VPAHRRAVSFGAGPIPGHSYPFRCETDLAEPRQSRGGRVGTGPNIHCSLNPSDGSGDGCVRCPSGQAAGLAVHATHSRRRLDDCPSDLHRRRAQDRIRTSRPAPRGRRGAGGSHGAPPWTAAWFLSCCGADASVAAMAPIPICRTSFTASSRRGAWGRLRSFHTRHSPWGVGLLGAAVPRGGVESPSPPGRTLHASAIAREHSGKSEPHLRNIRSYAGGRMKSCLWVWPHFSRGFHIRVARVQIVRGSRREGTGPSGPP
jgi:hypothetical protein